MSFKLEPCPYCVPPTTVRLIKVKDETAKSPSESYIECGKCRLKLVCFGCSMMDAARVWNMRTQRIVAIEQHGQDNVTLMHAELMHLDEPDSTIIELPNNDMNWSFVVAALTANDMDTTPIRPVSPLTLKIERKILRQYLDALVDEIKQWTST